MNYNTNVHCLTFPSTKKLRDLAKATLEAKEFKVAYEDKYTNKKSFWLVKDEGIYVMSCYKGEKSIVAFARGYNPNTLDRNEVWDKANDVSRDDFAENIPLSETMLQDLIKGQNLHIHMNDEEIKTMVWG